MQWKEWVHYRQNKSVIRLRGKKSPMSCTSKIREGSKTDASSSVTNEEIRNRCTGREPLVATGKSNGCTKPTIGPELWLTCLSHVGTNFPIWDVCVRKGVGTQSKVAAIRVGPSMVNTPKPFFGRVSMTYIDPHLTTSRVGLPVCTS